MRNKSFFSLLLGIAAGTAIGMLYAPDKGSATRAKVKKAATDSLDDIKETLSGAAEEAQEKATETAQETREGIKTIREIIAKKGAEIKEGTRNIRLSQLEKLEATLKKADEAEAGASSDESVDDQQPGEDE